MKYQIVTYGHSVLRAKARPIKKVDEGIRQLAQDMLATMYANNGLGLAAQQVGHTEAICVVDVAGARIPEGGVRDVDAVPLVLLNPVVGAKSGEESEQEGCLSFPEIFVPIKRAAEISVEYMDMEGKTQSLTATGLLARAIQHEIDHLNGRLLVDRMSPVQKVSMAGKLKRLRKQAAERG